MFILFCRCRDVWVCGLYLSLCSLYMAFYAVCYFLRSEEGNASQIICSLDYNHVKSLLPSVIETCLSLNWCRVPFPFVGILGRRDQLHAWAPLAICSFAICEGGCDLAEFCALAQMFIPEQEVGCKNATLVLPFLCFDLSAQSILSPCFLKVVSVGKGAWRI